MHLWLLLQVQVAVGAEKTDVLPPSLGTSQTSRYSIFCILFYSILFYNLLVLGLPQGRLPSWTGGVQVHILIRCLDLLNWLL